MCFSATGSFAATIELTGAGIIALRKAPNKYYLMFAATPFLFAIQQLAEGVVWLSIANPSLTAFVQPATVMFLFFALAVWPIWVPASLWLIEQQKLSRRLLMALTCFGLAYSIFAIYVLANFPFRLETVSHSLVYNIDYDWRIYRDSLLILYTLPTVLPFFLSRQKRIWILGIFIVIAWLVSYTMMYVQFLSVWCFFAAILSLLVIWLLRQSDA